MDENIQEKSAISIGCTGCGADLVYKPGTTKLTCEYCEAENEIPQDENVNIETLNYHSHFESILVNSETQIEHYLKCDNCGAESTVDKDITASNCHYCDTPLIVDKMHDEATIMQAWIMMLHDAS